MARKTFTIDMPIVSGQHEEVDAKMLPAGAVKTVKNMRLLKDGRWGVRHGFDNVSDNTQFNSDLDARDLILFDDRLLAIGQSLPNRLLPSNVYEYVDLVPFTWKSNAASESNTHICPVQSVRDTGRLPSQGLATAAAVDLDCAAANGLVCMVFDSTVHIYVADTDSTVLLEQVEAGAQWIHVCAVGNIFHIHYVTSGGTLVRHREFDPATDITLGTLTDAYSSVGNIASFDAIQDQDGSAYWLVVSTDTPQTTIRHFDGTATHDVEITGPATEFSRIAICETTAAMCLVTGGNPAAVSLRTYNAVSGAAIAGPTALFASESIIDQVGLSQGVDASTLLVAANQFTGSFDILVEPAITSAIGGLAQETWFNSSLTTKPIRIDAGGTADGIVMFGGNFLEDGGLNSNFMGVFSQEMTVCTKDVFLGGKPSAEQTPTMAYDLVTGKTYWPNLFVDSDDTKNVQVSEVSAGTSERRQTMSMDGHLLLSGGAPQFFDSRVLCDAGFSERPLIQVAAGSNGAGILPSSVDILLSALWEWTDARGDIHLSPISPVTTVTMGATDDTITAIVTTPHSLRENATSSFAGGSVQVVLFRSEGDRTILKRAETGAITNFGEPITITMLRGDTDIGAQPAIYTQSGRGALGDILEHEAPQPFEYCWRIGERAWTAGLPNPYRVQVSKILFPGEPVEWSNSLGFFVSIPERVRGIAGLDGNVLIFSREGVWTTVSTGPDDAGGGDIPPPIRLPGSTGLKDWKSLVETPMGIVFQGDDDKLWLIPRGGGAPQSFGDPIEDTLAAYPNVVAAHVAREEQLVTLSCVNDASDSTRMVSFDMRAQVWSVDEGSPEIALAAASTQHQGRTARVSISGAQGTVQLERTTNTPAVFIDHGMTTGTVRPFKDAGWGRLNWFLWLTEFRGDCTAVGSISYDEGATWTAVQSFELLDSAYTVGDSIRLQFWPARRKGDRFQLRLDVDPSSGNAPTAGLYLNELTIGVTGERGGPRIVDQRG